jgi:uncharacterized protein (TIGR02449 family)
MIEKDLMSLQVLVDNLISSHNRLAAENNNLHQKLAAMQQTNASLLDKKEEAFKKLRVILTQIKEGALCL